MRASRLSTTPSRVAARWPRRTPSPPRTPTSAWPRCSIDRLDQLAEMSHSKNVVPASVQFVDIGGLVEGASTGEGLGNKFLANIREADAIVFVLRAFVDDDVPGPSDPLEHLRIVETELALADLETVENQIEKRRKAAKQDRSIADEVEALGRAHVLLAEGTPIYRSDLDDESTARCIRRYFLLTNKPVLAIVNVGEDDLDRIDELIAPVVAELGDHGEVIGMCVQLEAEAAQLDAERAGRDARGSGLGEGALPRFLHTAYQMLGLRTFFTTGEKESRAWTFRAGLEGAAVRGRDPHRLRAWLHPRRGHPLGRSARGRIVVEGPRRSAPCGWRARTTSSPTATSWRSASTSEAGCSARPIAPVACRHARTVEPARPVAGARRPGARHARGGRTRRGPAAAACSVVTASTGPSCCAGPVGAHLRHALHHRRGPSRRRHERAPNHHHGPEPSGPSRVARPCGDRVRGGRLRRRGPCTSATSWSCGDRHAWCSSVRPSATSVTCRPRRRGAGAGRCRGVRGHPPDRPAARPHRRAGTGPARGQRPHRGRRRRATCSPGSIGASGSRWSPMPACPASPIRASGWWRAAAAAGHGVEVVPGPSAALAGAGGQRPARPAASCSRGSCPGRGRGAASAWPGRRRAAHGRALRGAPPAGPHARRSGRGVRPHPPGRAGPRAHQAPRGAVAGDVWAPRSSGATRSSPVASTCWSWTVHRSRRRPTTTTSGRRWRRPGRAVPPHAMQ